MKSSFNKYWILVVLIIIIFIFVFRVFSEKLGSSIENEANTRTSIDKLKR
ncbi:MAG: hypothetical protein O210_OD1C00001G0477 [Parcubacteria bacterium RAAC4_OD1_1]|nr:MAG: hypothetical protein O210_OD1C00001G0477 [Parcubacteria bacterium RAAC4_OD1_1]